MEWKEKWIKPAWETGSEALLFARTFRIMKPLMAAELLAADNTLTVLLGGEVKLLQPGRHVVFC